MQLEKTLNGELLRAVISMPASGYISGQAIPITIDIDNASNVQIKRIKVALKRKEMYIYGKFENIENSEKLTGVLIGGVAAKSSKKMRQLFVVPPLQPTYNIGDCISWFYELEVRSMKNKTQQLKN